MLLTESPRLYQASGFSFFVCIGFGQRLNIHRFNNHHPDNIDRLKGGFKERVDGWVAEWVDGWVLSSRRMGMGGLQKLITGLVRFYTYKGGVRVSVWAYYIFPI